MEKIAKFQSLTHSSYLLRETDPEARLFILNHGFMSTHQKMWDRFIDRLPKGANILAPNGPFPIPVKQEKSWKVGYSWFFYDNFNDHFLVGYDVCSAYITNLVDHLGFSSNLKTIIGFSQGGYAAPFMAQTLANVDHVIGLGCRFKIKNPQWQESLIIEALHGEEDDIVECPGATESFYKLPEAHRGRFQSFANTSHKPSSEMLDLAAQWASSHPSR